MKRTSTGFSLPPDLLKWLKSQAASHGLSLSGFVTMQLLKVKRADEEGKAG